MATFQPPFEHLDELLEPLGTDAFDVVRNLAQLDDEWTVYTRPRFGQDIADFVLLHDRHGVIVVDVWTGSDTVVGIARRHRNTIVDQFFSLPGDGRDPGPAVRSAVVVPHRSTAEGLSMLADALPTPGPIMTIWGADAQTTHLAAVVMAPPGVRLSSESIRRLHHQLVADGVSHETVTPVHLSAEACVVAANPNGSRIRGVTGPPGSGKSFALTARAARLAAEGKSVLVLCFNLTLAHRLRGLVVEGAPAPAPRRSRRSG